MVKISKGLGPFFQDMDSKDASKSDKKQARYIATKNKEAFSWVGDKLWYQVSQKIKAVFGKSDYQAMKKESKEAVVKAFDGQGYDKKKIGRLVDFQIDLYVKLNQFDLQNPKASQKQIQDFIKDLASKHHITNEQLVALFPDK